MSREVPGMSDDSVVCPVCGEEEKLPDSEMETGWSSHICEGCGAELFVDVEVSTCVQTFVTRQTWMAES